MRGQGCQYVCADHLASCLPAKWKEGEATLGSSLDLVEDLALPVTRPRGVAGSGPRFFMLHFNH